MSNSLVRSGIALILHPTFRKGLLSLIDQMIVSSSNFLAGVILSRACGAEEFGLYSLGYGILLCAAHVQGALISTPYMIYSPRESDSGRAEYMGSTLIHQLIISASTAIVLSIAALVLSLSPRSRSLSMVIFALAIGSPLILLKEYVRGVCFADLKLKTVFVVDVCTAFFQIGGMLLLVSVDALGANRTFIVMACSCGIAGVGWFLTTRKKINMNLTSAINHFKRSWSFGKWVIADYGTFILTSQCYPWFVAGSHGPAAAGALAACSGVVSLSNPLILSINNYLGPKTSQAYTSGGHARVRRILVVANVLLTAIMGAFCMMLLFWGGQLVTYVYGLNYADYGPITFVLATAAFAGTLGIPIGFVFLAAGRPDFNLKSNLIGLTLTLTIGLWLVNTIGIAGAAFGLLLGNTATTVTRYIVFLRLQSGCDREGKSWN